MIDFGDAQTFDGLDAIGEGVEAGAEDDDLPHAPPDSLARRVFGHAAAHGDVEAQAAPLRVRARLGDGALGVLAQNAQRQRVGQHQPAVENLMDRAVTGRAERGAAELAFLHRAKLAAGGGVVDAGATVASWPNLCWAAATSPSRCQAAAPLFRFARQ